MIPVQKSFPPELLRRWRKVMRETRLTPRESFDRWKLSQQRQSWIYAAIGGAVLCLIIFVVAGGCR